MSPRIMAHQHDISDAMRETIEKKIEHLRRFHERITEVSVILDAEGNRNQAEILMWAPRMNLRVKGEADDMRTAFEAALNKAERVLRKNKQRLQKHTRDNESNVTIRRFTPADAVQPDPTPEDGTPEGLHQVPAEQIAAKPMSIDEAKLQVQASGSGLLVFRNADTGELNVLHRTQEGEHELIELGPSESLYISDDGEPVPVGEG